MTMAEQALLTVVQVADYLRVSKAAVYKLCENRRIRHHRVGTGIGRGSIRILPTAIESICGR